MKTPVIEAEGLTFVRGSETIIDNFSFSICQGEYTAVIGPNGGGKSTLIKIILGLLPAASGRVRLFGLPQSDPSVRRRIGYVPQRGGAIEATFPALVYEVVKSGRTQVLGLWKRFGATDERAIEHALETMRVGHLRVRTIASLSGGERQRVLIARALAAAPKILVLDEPVEGLDPDSREQFYESMRRLKAEGTTLLFVTHDIHRVVAEADSAICLKHERVCHGTKACVLRGKEVLNLHHGTKADLTANHEGHEHHF